MGRAGHDFLKCGLPRPARVEIRAGRVAILEHWTEGRAERVDLLEARRLGAGGREKTVTFNRVVRVRQISPHFQLCYEIPNSNPNSIFRAEPSFWARIRV